MTVDFVAAGQPSGWYRHPSRNLDYFWTGRGFGTVRGEFIRRRHRTGSPDYEEASNDDAAAWVRRFGVVEPEAGIARERIVTLPDVPGQRTTRVLGVVTELASASGWTAASKGSQALTRALEGLGDTAADLGANAIVGLTATAFGAHGGLTSGLGGDAVGVLLTGTAVIVEAVPNGG